MYTSIRWKIIVPILFFLAAVFIFMALFLSNQMEKTLVQKGETTVSSIQIGLENALISRQTAEKILEKEMVGQASMLALLYDKGTDYKELEKLSENSGIDEFWVTNAQGSTILTNMAPSVDFNFGSDPNGQAYEFMKLAVGEAKVVTQKAANRSVDNKFYKFVGVPGWDDRRIVQVGRDGSMLKELDRQVGIQPLIERLKTDLSSEVKYAAVLSSSGKVLASTSEETAWENEIKGEKNWKDTFNGEDVLFFSKPLSNGQLLIVALSNELIKEVQLYTGIAAFTSMLLVLIVVYFVIQTILKPLGAMKESLNEISRGEGDLTARLPISSKDEIGQLAKSFNRTIETIQSVIFDTKKAAIHVTDSALALSEKTAATAKETSFIFGVIRDIEESAKTQTAMTDENVHTTMLLAQNIEKISESSGELFDNSEKTREAAETGHTVIKEAVSQMKTIDQTVQSLSNTIATIQRNADEIGSFLATISAISAQTNLLALNAAIEAARAGEHGRGFSVVAEEVRKLANETDEATNQIQSLISRMKQEVSQSAVKMEESSRYVTGGKEITEEAGYSFTHVLEAIRGITEKIHTISSATGEVSAGTEEVNAAIETIAGASHATQGHISSMVEKCILQENRMAEMGEYIQALYKSAELLQKKVHTFKTE